MASFRPGLGFFVCALLVWLAAFAVKAGAVNLPNDTYQATRATLTGDNTYAQLDVSNVPVRTKRQTFKFEDTLILTGNAGKTNLIIGRDPASRLYIQMGDSGDNKLVVQRGTMSFSQLSLRSQDGRAIMLIGSDETVRPSKINGTVKIFGAIAGMPVRLPSSMIGHSILQTNGANLEVTGCVGAQGYVGEVRAWKGDITMTVDVTPDISPVGVNHTAIGVLSVADGMKVTNNGMLIILDNLDLAPKATVQVNGITSFQTQISNTKPLSGGSQPKMQYGSILQSTNYIEFRVNTEIPGNGKGGIYGASGTFKSNKYITGLGYDLDQGPGGRLTLDAGEYIVAKNIMANTLKAGTYIGAGSTRTAASPLGFGAVVPDGRVASSNITAPLVAAGEVTDNSGVKGELKIGNLLVAKGTGENAASGDFTLRNSSFSLTGTKPIGNAGYNADGSVFSRDEASWIGGNMTVNNTGKSSFTTLGVGGATKIGGGSLSGDTLNTNSITLHNGIDARITNVNLRSSGTGFARFGAAGDSPPLTRGAIENLRLNGGELQAVASSGTASGAVNNFVSASGSRNFVDGNINIGANGMLALGTSDARWLPGQAAAAGSNRAAVFGVFNPIVLGGALNVDPLWSPSPRTRSGRANAGNVEFAPGSLLVIRGGDRGVNYTGQPVATASLPVDKPGAISASSPTVANVQSGAKIYIADATPGHTYIALGKNITTRYADSSAWNGTNLISSNPLLQLERLGNGKEGQFSVTEAAPHVSGMPVLSGVPRLARTASETMEAAIYQRIKLGEEDLYRRNFAVWALPLYESINHFNLDGGDTSYGYKGGLGGIAFGGDYTWQDCLRAGIAFNIGAGYAKSMGDVASTHNNLDFWGVGVYGVWKPGAFSLDADINSTFIYNKVKQELPQGLDAAEVKSDIQAWSLGASLRAEYEIPTKYVNFRAHAGARYFHLEANPYDITMAGQDVMRGHRFYQNVWTFPFGLVLVKDFKLDNGFEITPLLNLKVTPASGDTYVKSSVRYMNAHRDIELSTQVMDSITYGGRAGIEFRKNDFTLGVNYTGQFGSHTANHGMFGVLRYEF